MGNGVDEKPDNWLEIELANRIRFWRGLYWGIGLVLVAAFVFASAGSP